MPKHSSRSSEAKHEFRPRSNRITFEVLRHRLWQINDEQGRTILNVSGSPIASESNDFNVTIADACGHLVCIGPYIIAHLSAISLVIQNMLRLFGPDWVSEGDMYLSNDPWLGAVHQNDACVIAPVHWEGELVAWTGSVIHQVDVGGGAPGSWNSQATDTFQEAPRYRCLKVVREGKVQPEVVETYLTNSRTPDQLELDLRSQVAAANVAKSRLLELFSRYGVQVVLDVMQDSLDYSEVLLRRKLAGIPEGQWFAEDYVDHDGHEDRIYVTRLNLRKTGDGLVFDYRGTDAQAPGFINCTYSGLLAGPFVATLAYLCNDIPWNDGALRCLEVLCEDGTINNARFPAPVSSGIVNAGWSGANAATAAVARMLSCSEEYKENLMAVWAGSVLAYNLFGVNQYGEPFGTMLGLSPMQGAGARYFADGYDVGGFLQGPRPSVMNVETAELRFPILYAYRKRAIDSGGPGRFRGGVSAENAITPYCTEVLNVNITSFGSDHSSSVGIDGGYPAGGANTLLKTGTDFWERLRSRQQPTGFGDWAGDLEALPPKLSFQLHHGDVLIGVPHGGGGFGDPLDRDPLAVERDVIEGYISPERATTTYGVVLELKSLLAVNEATEQLRASMRKERLRAGTLFKGRVRQDSVEEEDADTRQRYGENMFRWNRVFYCAHCRKPLCEASSNPKSASLSIERDLFFANPWTAMRWGGKSNRFRLIEFFCPSCAHLIDVELQFKFEPGG